MEFHSEQDYTTQNHHPPLEKNRKEGEKENTKSSKIMHQKMLTFQTKFSPLGVQRPLCSKASVLPCPKQHSLCVLYLEINNTVT